MNDIIRVLVVIGSFAIAGGAAWFALQLTVENNERSVIPDDSYLKTYVDLSVRILYMVVAKVVACLSM